MDQNDWVRLCYFNKPLLGRPHDEMLKIPAPEVLDGLCAFVRGGGVVTGG